MLSVVCSRCFGECGDVEVVLGCCCLAGRLASMLEKGAFLSVGLELGWHRALALVTCFLVSGCGLRLKKGICGSGRRVLVDLRFRTISFLQNNAAKYLIHVALLSFTVLQIRP